MNLAISPGLLPQRPGLEREEPEIAHEDDIPPEHDEDNARPPPEGAESGGQPPRHAGRE
jgi:hypothetical protein